MVTSSHSQTNEVPWPSWGQAVGRHLRWSLTICETACVPMDACNGGTARVASARLSSGLIRELQQLLGILGPNRFHWSQAPVTTGEPCLVGTACLEVPHPDSPTLGFCCSS